MRPTPARPSRRRPLVLAAGTLVVLLVGAAAVTTVRGRDDAEASASPDRQSVPVERRDLVESESVTGQLGFGDAATLTARDDGMLTWLPEEAATITRGGVLYRSDDEPVVLLYGRIPLYRALAAGDEGTDVKLLEKNLVALGYAPDDLGVDRTFTSYTAAAVVEMQADLGLEETGTVTPESFAMLPRAVRVGAATSAVGAPVMAGEPLYDLTSTSRLVRVDLDPAQTTLATVGDSVTLTLPDGTTTPGTITAKGSAATAEGQDDPVLPVEVTVDDASAVSALDFATVSVGLVREVREATLAVPVTALVALAEGGYAVYVPAEGTPAEHRLVGVETGLYAGGFVEVSGDGLDEGTLVEVPA